MSGMTVAVVGLGFGSEFIPIYRSHPAVSRVLAVDASPERRAEVAVAFGLDRDDSRSFEQVLSDRSVDAVHILTPVHLHAEMVLQALDAGKHVACAVPMATTLDDLARIRRARTASGTQYMMMETAAYTREFLQVQAWYPDTFGELTLYRGFHIQNLDGYPTYWQGFPPMHYLTHALSPILALLDTTVTSVVAHGAGRLEKSRRTGGFDNEYPAEVGLFRLNKSDVLAEVTMAFAQNARPYTEGFCLYGSDFGVEWPSDNEGPLTVFDMAGPAAGSRGNRVTAREIAPPVVVRGLPPELHAFTRRTEVLLPGMPKPVLVEPHHGGSHPFLVHEFIQSVIERREPFIGADRAAAWTAPGICAHESAMRGGVPIEVPQFDAVID